MSDDKMTEPAPNGSSKGSMRPWLRIVLFASLALNLAVLGIVAGAFARFGPAMDRLPRADRIAGIYTHALTVEDRHRIGRELLRDHRDALPTRQAMSAEYQAMVTVLRSQPFDADTAAAILRRQLDFGQTRAELGHALLLQRLTEMSDAERADYADRLEQALQTRFRKGRGHGPHGTLPHRGGE